MKPKVRAMSRTGARIVQPSSAGKAPRSPKNSIPTKNSSVSRPPTACPLHSLKGNIRKYSFPITEPFRSAKKSDLNALLETKIMQCLQMVNIQNDSNDDIVAKKILLNEIAETISIVDISESKRNYQLILTLIARHLYRTPPSLPSYWVFSLEMIVDDNDITVQDWDFLSFIYDIAIAFLKRQSIKFDLCLPEIADLLKLSVYLCRSPSLAEQKKLISLILTIYKRIKSLRAFTQQMLLTSIIRVAYDTDPFTIIRPTLSVLLSTLRKQDIQVIYPVVSQLLRNPHYSYFHSVMFHLLSNMLELDSSLSIPLYKEIVSYWPRTNNQKQLDFLSLIGMIASFVTDVPAALHYLLPRLVTCVTSCQAGVAEATLLLWQVNDFVWLMTESPELSYPLLLPALFQTAASYWEPIVKSLATTVLDLLRQNNSKMFLLLGQRIKEITSGSQMRILEKGVKWMELVSIANPPGRKTIAREIRALFC